jgi:DNA-binding NtrC family response regulator
MEKTILVVDDELNIRKFIKMAYAAKGHDVYVAASAEEAFKVLDNHEITIMITDMRLPKMNGLELIKKVRERKKFPYMVMMTAYSEVDLAVDAMKAGAYDFLAKPFKIEELRAITDRIFKILNVMNESNVEKTQIKKIAYQDMIGRSEHMRTIFSLIEKVAPKLATVMITGESGTGKELVARAIHEKSKRKNKHFIGINCTAITESLLESELFGFEKGAFTDAKSQKPGLFELADGGTLFFDEIGDMPLNLQAKLLRVIQEKTFRRIGGQKDISVDVRFISATHQNLEKRIEEKKFREDLYFRLNVFPISLPPLRERGEDILLLAHSFLHEFSKDSETKPKKLSPNAEDSLLKYQWRGNIRELKNVIERTVIIEESDIINVSSLPDFIRHIELLPTKTTLPFKTAKQKLIEEFEVKYLTDLLSKNKGNVSASAKEANLDRSAFQRLMRKYKILSTNFRME